MIAKLSFRTEKAFQDKHKLKEFMTTKQQRKPMLPTSFKSNVGIVSERGFSCMAGHSITEDSLRNPACRRRKTNISMRTCTRINFTRKVGKQMRIRKTSKHINSIKHQHSNINKGKRNEHTSFKTTRRKKTKMTGTSNTFQ
jgi:hypothetical protein